MREILSKIYYVGFNEVGCEIHVSSGSDCIRHAMCSVIYTGVSYDCGEQVVEGRRLRGPPDLPPPLSFVSDHSLCMLLDPSWPPGFVTATIVMPEFYPTNSLSLRPNLILRLHNTMHTLLTTELIIVLSSIQYACLH